MSTTGEVVAFVEALCGSMGSASAHRAAALLDHVGGELSRIATRQVNDSFADDLEWASSGLLALETDRPRHWNQAITRLAADGVRVVTAGMASYPLNLQLVSNRPPLLFSRGEYMPSDERAIAIVGTRKPSAEGRLKAADVARRLALRGVTVVSGLAEGIDAVAHQAALDAGGRTLAVFGTGIDHVSPSSNKLLARSVSKSGACLSQWWPAQGGTKWTFPLRNIVTSGLSLGTVVIEAGETSGAKLQAQDARRHGRRLFLLDHLVTQQEWARKLVGEPGVHVVRHVSEIMELVSVDLNTDLFADAESLL